MIWRFAYGFNHQHEPPTIARCISNKCILQQLDLSAANLGDAMEALRQMNAEARGWMDPIPDWVGNRTLAVP